MKLSKQSVLLLLSALALSTITFVLGWYEGQKTDSKYNTAGLLVMDVTMFGFLEEGKIDLLKAFLATKINGEIQYYDILQKEDPNYGKAYKLEPSVVEKARGIVQKQYQQDAAIQTESK